MEITYCNLTGLLYVNDVAFTKEMYKRIKSLISASTDQFEYNVVIYDNGNNSQVTIDSELLSQIEFKLKKLKNKIASDKDFE